MIDRAKRFARNAHMGQEDKGGAPYYGHLARTVSYLMEMLPEPSEDEIVAAWLHDVLEDRREITADDLRAAGFSPRSVEIIQAVTRPAGTEYLAWIRALANSGDVSAIRVKLADNTDNTDPGRIRKLADGHRLLCERYMPAREILCAALGLTEIPQGDQK